MTMTINETKPHPVHNIGRTDLLPSQASGLFYTNRLQGRAFLAKGAVVQKFQTSHGPAVLIWNNKFRLGMIKAPAGNFRLMTPDELEAATRFIASRLKAAQAANEPEA